MKLAKLLFYIISVAAYLSLSGCKSKKIDDDQIVPEAELYQEGINLLKKQQYSKAAEEFARIFYQDPGNKISPQAELMQSYALFLEGQYDEAVDVLDMFIKLHPMNEDIAYAYYLKALAYYMRISNVKLDQSRTFLTRDSFEEVMKLFPKTKYAIDAALKIDLVNDHLAGKEMDVGRYYLQKNNPIAAINRFQLIIEEYQTTSHIPEALYRLVESNLMLGINEEAKKYAAVLGYNYHGNIWYKHAYSLISHSVKK